MNKALLLLLALGGCAETFELPMTAAQFAAHNSGPALVAYLGQPDASPVVCDMRAQGPHLTTVDGHIRDALTGALLEGTVEPQLWHRCVSALARSTEHEDTALLVDTFGHTYRKLLKNSKFETTPTLRAQLAVLQQFYLERTNGLDGHQIVVGKLFADLRSALATHRLGPAATSFGTDLLNEMDLEHGQWEGHAVSVPTLDALYAAGDEKMLRRFLLRLPEPSLRDEANRRVIRIHIAASPFPEVRKHSAAVEKALMKLGMNPLSLAAHPPVRGWIEPTKLLMRGVLVRQQVWPQTATLLGYSGDRPGISVLPELSLHGVLQVEAKGVSHAVSLCQPAAAFDPSPCIKVEDVTLDHPATYLDKGGAFHFVEHIAMRDAVNLTQMRDKFILPVRVGGRQLTRINWGLYYERPNDLILIGPYSGAKGPNVRIQVDNRDEARFIFNVFGSGGPYLAVVERPDAASFHAGSSGAQGSTGSSGSRGSSGSSGSECRSGGRGGDGYPGRSGGPGGDGGTVQVELSCGDAACPDAVALLAQAIVSTGGAGGPGGSGGAGGSGGSGGSGRATRTHTDSHGNTVTDDYGCSAGSSGPSGSNGPSGSFGSPGRAGRVTVQVVR